MLKVLKFGGTSLGDHKRIISAAEIVMQNDSCLVVCSAMAGMTNELLRVAEFWKSGDISNALNILDSIENNFIQQSELLFPGSTEACCNDFNIVALFENARIGLTEPHTIYRENALLALGEMLTSRIFNNYLSLSGRRPVLLNALELVYLDEDNQPDIEDIANRLHGVLDEGTIYVTQGFIATSFDNKIANLNRGGSDYSATLIAAAINAPVVEIWTDIDGIHNNDPRFVEHTFPIRELSYDEAAELAYFGAKILHPLCIGPVRAKNLPVLLKNSLMPYAEGTLIHSHIHNNGIIRAIAAKDGITILRITSGRMLNAYGFLERIFDIFRSMKISVDVVTTSEVSVSVTIDDSSKLEMLVSELEMLGKVDIENERCIVCIVGDVMHPGHIADIMQRVRDFDIRMISLGASSNNITLVLPQDQKIDALNALNGIFNYQGISFSEILNTN
jgi:aspartate kinase